MQYKHFSIEEREQIQYGLWEQKSVRQIAKDLKRSPSSVSREINKNRDSLNRRFYLPRPANEKALHNRKKRGRKNRLKSEQVRQYVISHLKLRWSPEQIAGRIKTDIPGRTISHEAIYQFIYNQVHRKGWGQIKKGKEDLRIFLRRRKKRRTHKGQRRCQRVFKPLGTSIELRPEIVNKRMRIGDWESDSVISKDQKPGINTVVERKVGLVFVTKLENKKAESTVSAIENRMKYLPKKLKKTITFDNGSENQRWQEIEQKTGLKTYFAHPYCSGERGTNENTNGLIRDFFPKKTDFTQVSEQELQAVEGNLNNRPRKRLNWLTPLEAFAKELDLVNIKFNMININSVALVG